MKRLFVLLVFIFSVSVSAFAQSDDDAAYYEEVERYISEVDAPFVEGEPYHHKNAFALIIGNEKYSQVGEPDVKYAYNDAYQMERYADGALSISKDRTVTVYNATYDNMVSALKKLEALLELHPKGGKDVAYVVIYYAGHSLEHPRYGRMLLPVDVSRKNPERAFSLGGIFEVLDRQQVGVSLLLMETSFPVVKGVNYTRPGGINVELKRDATSHGTLVISAAANNQSVHFYNEMQHGLFTYFLLKTLKSNTLKYSSVSFDQLLNYLKVTVPRISYLYDGKEQTPTVFGTDYMMNSLSDFYLP